MYRRNVNKSSSARGFRHKASRTRAINTAPPPSGRVSPLSRHQVPCYHPLKAHQAKPGARPTFGGPLTNIKLPCNRCIGCRLERSKQWAVRLMHEANNTNKLLHHTHHSERRSLRDAQWELGSLHFQRRRSPIDTKHHVERHFFFFFFFFFFFAYVRTSLINAVTIRSVRIIILLDPLESCSFLRRLMNSCTSRLISESACACASACVSLDVWLLARRASLEGGV